MKDLNAIQRDMMYIINGLDKPTGLQIQAELESYYEKDVPQGRIFPNIDVLVSMEYVDRVSPSRNIRHELTNDGRELINSRSSWTHKRKEN